MKKITLLAAFITLTAAAFSQPFTKKADITLPDSISDARTAWADLNNDGLLDLLLVATDTSDQHHFMFVEGDVVNALQLSEKTTPVFTSDTWALIDYNRDNQTDIIVSGTEADSSATVIYINKGEFEFEEIVTSLPVFTKIKLADLDNDARAEWILSGEDSAQQFYTHIMKEVAAGGTWKVVHDSLQMKLTALEVLDANGDGRHDLFVSGTRKPDSLFTGFLLNQGGFHFLPYRKNAWAGTTSLSDHNHDGFMDVTFAGKDKNGNTVSRIIRSSMQGYSEYESEITLDDTDLFTADLNADGKVDLSYRGKSASGDTLNIIKYRNLDYDTLPHGHVFQQQFGDREHDGDLDLVQVLHQQPLVVRVIENQQPGENIAPAKPASGVALPVFNRMFLYWDLPGDDHTPLASLTYDLFFYAGTQLQAGDYDLLLDRRLVVGHGNNGTQNFRLLKKIPVGPVQYSVQAVDNAMHAGYQCLGVGGSGGSAQICATVQERKLSACSAERVTLTSPVEALWFSFARGYLGQDKEMDFQLNTPDTVFYYAPKMPVCSALKAWAISTDNDTIKTEIAGEYACLNAPMQFEAERGWDKVNWKSQLKGNLGAAATIQYTFTQPDTVVLTLSNALGCTIIRKTGIAASQPDVQAEPNYKIVKGQSVQLSASGAKTYEWSPAGSLDRTDVPNPVASPLETTTYAVTGYDSLGCQDNATVRVFVESTGFVPTLFTPNDDGQNDQLKLYGLTSVSNFTFSIYNREGSLVFKTSNINEAAQHGWDGTTNGQKQPSGVYYWKVKGTIGSNFAFLLNGKDSGAIILVR